MWKYFTKYVTGGQCNTCQAYLKTMNSTSVLLSHLRCQHPEIWDKLAHLYPSRGPSPMKSKKRKPAAHIPRFHQAEGTSQKFILVNPSSMMKRKPKSSSESNSSQSHHMDHAIVSMKHESNDDQAFEMEPPEMDTHHQRTKKQSPTKSSHSKQRPNSSEAAAINSIDALIDFIVRDEQPLNVTELYGFRHLIATVAPSIELPSQCGLSLQLNYKFGDCVSGVRDTLYSLASYSLSISEWTDGGGGRTFLGITCHYVDPAEIELKSAMLSFDELSEDCSEDDLVERLEVVFQEWGLIKSSVTSVAMPGSALALANACTRLFGQEKVINCAAVTLNDIAKQPFEALPELHRLIDEVRMLTEFLRNCEEIITDESEEGQQLWELIYTTNSTWMSIYKQLNRFLKCSGRLQELLDLQPDAPPMPIESVMAEIRDVVKVIGPLKGVCDDLCSDAYLMASKVIPLIQILLASLDSIWPETPAGVSTKKMITEQIHEHFADMEEHEIYSLATLVDPRFKKNYFKNTAARDGAIERLKDIVSLNQDPLEKAGQSSEGSADAIEGDKEEDSEGIWKLHTAFIANQPSATVLPVNVYLSARTADLMNTNPLKYFLHADIELRPACERLLVSQATCVPAKKVFSEAGCTLPHNWTNLPMTEIRKLMFLASFL